MIEQEELKHLVELQHDVHGERDIGVRFVNELQGVPVSGDFLLRPIARLGAAEDQVGDPAGQRDDAFYAVRGFGGFDEGVGAQGVELFGELVDEKVLPAPGLAKAVDIRIQV